LTRSRLDALALLAAALGAGLAAGQEDVPQEKFRLRVEIKAGARVSRAAEAKTSFPFPPAMIPAGQSAVLLKTVDEGASLEANYISLRADGQLTPHVAARADVHVLDLYSRNPTSADELVALREAWLRFGTKVEAGRRLPGATFYAQLGKFPRFARQGDRRLESYGLLGTAVGRFEEIGLESGGSLGAHVYFRASLTNGNPLFFRDPNALAGDHGAPERARTPPEAVFESGFPILYDAKAQDVNLDGRFMVGAGLGLRWLAEDEASGLDVLGWYYRRDLEDKARVRGTFYSGDLQVLRGAGIPLPFAGREKSERGLNVEGRVRDFRAWGQYVSQDIAGLERHGLEVELSYRLGLNGPLVSGDEPVLNWLEPVLRYSRIDNDFLAPRDFVAPSMAWDWRKLDLGLRLGILRGVDLTAEYAFHHIAALPSGASRPHEALVTLRVAY
jgi:hypothetical protein